MPGCMGTAACADNQYDMSRCTCIRPTRLELKLDLDRRVTKLERQMQKLMQRKPHEQR